MSAVIDCSREDELYVEAIEHAIKDARTIQAMEGEFSPVEYRVMADLEAKDDAIAFVEYRKHCRRSLLRSWFTTSTEVDDYVRSNNPRKNILGGFTP